MIEFKIGTETFRIPYQEYKMMLDKLRAMTEQNKHIKEDTSDPSLFSKQKDSYFGYLSKDVGNNEKNYLNFIKSCNQKF